MELYRETHYAFFEQTPLNLITTKKLDNFYYVKLKEGLSPKTVREFHNLLRSAFKQAVKWSLLKINPALEATPPKLLLKEIQIWTKEQAKDFLKVLETEKGNPIFELIIFSGLRRGEALGLKWDDVDFLKGKIHVRRSLAKIKEKGLFLKDVKTKSFKRQVSISPYLIKRLQEHKRNQAKEKKVLGAAYQDSGFVFCTSDGKLKDPRNLLREFDHLIKKANLPKISIHDLRHLHATQLMISGVNPKVVQERLGHSRVAITLDLYSHVNEDLQVEAAIRLENDFFDNGDQISG